MRAVAINDIPENPVLCDERMYELMTVLESLNARVSGVSACATTTASPVLMRALGDDALPNAVPVVIQPSHLLYRRVGALIGHVLPDLEAPPPRLDPPLPPSNVVLKWPEETEVVHFAHPLADHLRLRDKNDSPR